MWRLVKSTESKNTPCEKIQYFQIWFWIYHSPWFSGVVCDIDLCAFHSFVQVSDFIMHPSCLLNGVYSSWFVFLLKYIVCITIYFVKRLAIPFLSWSEKKKFGCSLKSVSVSLYTIEIFPSFWLVDQSGDWK